MTHPDTDRLTAWVHDLLDPSEVAPLVEHLSGCAPCREASDLLRREARVLAGEISPASRLEALKEKLLRQAEPKASAASSRHGRGFLWQVPLAAAVLVGLVAVLASPGPRHRLVEGRVALEDGQELVAPSDLEGLTSWRLEAKDRASLRLSDRSTVELQPGTRLDLETRGDRGVQPRLSTGEARFVVAPDDRRFTVVSPSGRLESREGSFTVRIVFEDKKEGGTPMKGLMAGTLITVLAGSASLSNAQGEASVAPGQTAVLAASEAPLLVAAPQDADALLKRLEELAARVAKLEEEIGRLETRNKQLKEQLKAGGGAWVGGPGGVIRNPAPGAAVPGQPVIIELEEKLERATPRKDK